MADFPTTLPTHIDLECGDTRLPKDDINELWGEVIATATKVGADASATTTTHDYKLSGVATGDKATSLTGTEILTNKRLTSPKLNENVVVSATATELNILDGATLSTTEINKLASVTAGTSSASKALVLGASKNTDILVIDNAIKFNAPQGFLINGKIARSVASNNLTVAIKTLAGSDPSATDPVHIRIGDSIRTLTTALSVTLNAGTNYFNAGSSELATNEIDYFVYLTWKASDTTIVLGFSRIPNGRLYSDFSGTNTNQKYIAVSATPASTDECELVGRFNATLSATSAFNWSVPATSVIRNKPVGHSRPLSWTCSPGPQGGTYTSVTTTKSTYRVTEGGDAWVSYRSQGTFGATITEFRPTLPFTPAATGVDPFSVKLAGVAGTTQTNTAGFIQLFRYDAGNMPTGASEFSFAGIYSI